MQIHALYRAFQDRFRPKRMRQFVDLLGVGKSTRILDVGGCPETWRYIPLKPRVTVGNIDVEDQDRDGFSFRRADGTSLPFEDSSFDVAHSNSVIEHVGDWDRQKRFAEEIRRVAPYYFVQTPYRWFFVEPHFIAPFVHFLPRRLYRALLPLFSIWYWVNRPSSAETDALFEEVRLLDRKQMRELFPDAEILEERFLFFTKSLIAVRAPRQRLAASQNRARPHHAGEVLAPAHAAARG